MNTNCYIISRGLYIYIRTQAHIHIYIFTCSPHNRILCAYILTYKLRRTHMYNITRYLLCVYVYEGDGHVSEYDCNIYTNKIIYHNLYIYININKNIHNFRKIWI